MSALRILQVITDPDRRGAQIFAAELGKALTARGRRVRTVALAAGSQPRGLPVPVLGNSRLGPPTLGRLRRALRGADVAVGFGSSTLPACTVAAIGTGTPFVYRSIGELDYWANTPARRIRVRVALGRARAVVALWAAAADAITADFGVPDDRIHVIPRGVPAAAFPPVDPKRRPAARRRLGLADTLTLTVVGSLSPEKNVGAAIAAMQELPAFQLLVVGDGPQRADLEALAMQHAPGRVAFAGLVRDLGTVMAATDVVVLPSHSEGMPGVLIEAGLSRLPVVATDVGGVGDIVVPGETGEIVAPGDVAALAAGIRSAITQQAAYGEAAYERCVTRFEISVVAEAWDRLITDITNA